MKVRLIIVRPAMLLLTFMASTFSALASEGPWTAREGTHNIYAGVFVEQFECFESEGKNDPKCGSGLPVSSPVRQVGLKVFYRYGIDSQWDVAIAAPFSRSSMAGDPEGEAQEPTTGVGLIETRVRRRLGSTGGVDWSTSLGLRSGALHKDTRDRLTNLGEGTTDLFGTLSMGSTGLLGPRFYTTSIDLTYYYRFPLQVDDTLGKIPGDEARASAVFDYAVSSRFGLGVGVDGFHRLSGADLNFAEIASYGDDRWAALQASQVKAGARFMLYPHGSMPYLQVSAQRVVWAKNNPTDATFIEVAMGTDLGGRK